LITRRTKLMRYVSMLSKTTTSKIAFLTLTSLNVISGLLVTLLMMAGDFLNIMNEAYSEGQLETFDTFFLSYILHPATGIIYSTLFIGLAVYQFKIASISLRYISHLALLLLSCLILLEVSLLFSK
jgi:hypothetical protein